jgi:replication-associated recombination protein RarA
MAAEDVKLADRSIQHRISSSLTSMRAIALLSREIALALQNLELSVSQKNAL